VFPQHLKDARLDPLLKAVVGSGTGAELGGVQGLPLAAGAQHEQDGLHADAVGLARPTAAEAVGVFMFGKQGGDGLPQIVGDAPRIGDGMFVHGRVSAYHQSPSHKCRLTIHIIATLTLSG
jgi:hypothetical protein